MDTEKKLWRAREDELKLRIERLENCLLRKMVSPVADPAVSALLM